MWLNSCKVSTLNKGFSVRQQGLLEMEQMKPYLTEEEQADFDRLGAEKILELAKVETKEHDRIKQMNSRKIVRDKLKTLPKAIESCHTQKNGKRNVLTWLGELIKSRMIIFTPDLGRFFDKNYVWMVKPVIGHHVVLEITDRSKKFCQKVKTGLLSSRNQSIMK